MEGLFKGIASFILSHCSFRIKIALVCNQADISMMEDNAGAVSIPVIQHHLNSSFCTTASQLSVFCFKSVV